jgi:2'-5' RNA ligase
LYIPDYFVGIPVHIPPAVAAFRQLHDPKSGVNEAHITLVIPFSAKIMSAELTNHFQTVVARFKQFTLIAQQFYITAEGYIFYTFDAPSVELLRELHAQLCQHPLLAAQLTTRPFLPHITIGKFDSLAAVSENILQQLKEICVPHMFRVDTVRLYEIVDPKQKRVCVADYFLHEMM